MNLDQVHQLLTELHSPTSNNDRKKAIGQQIELIKSQPDWRTCLDALQTVQDQVLWFFCCSTVEVFVKNRWHTLSVDSRLQMRQSVWRLCVETIQPTKNIEKNKICQLVALIAKRDFPSDDPDFMNRLIEVLQSNFPLGLTICAAINTEIISTKADLTTEKKREFQTAVQMYMPHIMQILQHNLTIFARRIYGAAMPVDGVMGLQTIIENPDQLTSITIEFLTCLRTIFTWANLDTVLTNEMLKTLFLLANWSTEWSDVCITALSTISDLFYRQQAIALITEMAQEIVKLVHQPDLNVADEEYQNGVTELLCMFNEQQWKKWVNTPDFPVLAYLKLLINFTFSSNSSAIADRLQIWKPIIKAAKKNGTPDIREIILQLFTTILDRVQFVNDPDLEILDNDHLIDNQATEYQIFQNQCCDVIVAVAEIDPPVVFERVLTELNRPKGPMEWFNFVVSALPSKHDRFNPQPPVDQAALAVLNAQNRTVQTMLRDLSTLSQIVARLSPEASTAVSWIADSVETVTRNWMAVVRVVASKQISVPEGCSINNQNCLSMAVAQLLTAIKFMLLLPVLQRSDLIEREGFVDVLAQFLLPALDGGRRECSIIQQTSAQVLLTITSELRPKFVIENGHVQALATADLFGLEKSTQMSVYKIMFNLFTLPWDNATDQQFPHREKLLSDYVNMALAVNLVHYDVATLPESQNGLLIVLQEVLPTLSELLDHYQSATTHTKKMLKRASETVMERCIAVYRLVGTQNLEIAQTILSYFLSVVRTLQLQLGTVAVRDLLVLFFAGTSSSCKSSGVAGLQSLEILLKIELMIVEQPGAATMALIPEMLTIVLEQIIPLIRANENNHVSEYTDLTMATYMLFNGILMNRWQYFYTSQVKRGFSPGASDVLASDIEVVHHAEHFHGILTAYGQAIECGNDPELTRFVLVSLENVEKRCRLYSRDYFREHLLAHFLSALLRTITAPVGVILFEHLIEVLYKMARSSVEHFYQALLDFGTAGNAQFVNDLCSAEDLPTFTHYMQQIIQDIKVLRAGL